MEEIENKMNTNGKNPKITKRNKFFENDIIKMDNIHSDNTSENPNKSEDKVFNISSNVNRNKNFGIEHNNKFNPSSINNDFNNKIPYDKYKNTKNNRNYPINNPGLNHENLNVNTSEMPNFYNNNFNKIENTNNPLY